MNSVPVNKRQNGSGIKEKNRDFFGVLRRVPIRGMTARTIWHEWEKRIFHGTRPRVGFLKLFGAKPSRGGNSLSEKEGKPFLKLRLENGGADRRNRTQNANEWLGLQMTLSG